MRFYNSGKFTHRIGRHKETGEMIESVRDLKPSGHDVGTAIVNFPGHQICQPVKAGDWIDLPNDLTAEVVQRACPSLLTEAEAVAIIAAAESAASSAAVAPKGKQKDKE